MTYTVSFAKWYTYEVEADNIEEAIKQAENEYVDDITSPVCCTDYDSCIVEDENNKTVYEM